MVDTPSTLDQQSVDSRLSVGRLISIDQKLVHSQLTVEQDVDRVLVDRVSTELLMEYRLRVLIKGIVQHLTVDAFSKYLTLNDWSRGEQ